MSQVEDYGLKVDDQAGKLVELKQKLVYFLVTSATAVVVFLSKFALDYARQNRRALEKGETVRWLIGSALVALLSAGCALGSIYLGHKSYGRHIDLRYKKGTPSEEQKESWDRLGRWQVRLLASSSVLLILEIALALCYLGFLMW